VSAPAIRGTRLRQGVGRFALGSLALGVVLSWIVTLIAALEPFQHGYDVHVGGEWMVTQTPGLAVIERLRWASKDPPQPLLHAERFTWIPREVDPRTPLDESVAGGSNAGGGAVVAGWPWPQTMARWVERDSALGPVVAIEGGIRVPEVFQSLAMQARAQPVIPIRPIWFGIVRNTVVWSVVAGFILALRRALVRAAPLRRREVVVASIVLVLAGIALAYFVASRAGREVDPVIAYVGPERGGWTHRESGVDTGRHVWVFGRTGSAARLVWWMSRDRYDAAPNNITMPSWATFARARVRLATGDVVVAAYGWPWPAFAMAIEEIPAESGPSRYIAFRGDILELTPPSPENGLSEPGRWPSARVVPRLPLFGGLFLDGLVFAALLAASCLALAPELVVRAMRRRKGRCVQCGQKLMESQEQCPECGARRRQRQPRAAM